MISMRTRTISKMKRRWVFESALPLWSVDGRLMNRKCTSRWTSGTSWIPGN